MSKLLLLVLLILAGCRDKGSVEIVGPGKDVEVSVSEMVLVDKNPEESGVHKEFVKQMGCDRVSFGFDKNTLSTQDQKYLTKVATYMMQNADLRVEIQGNCDKRGSDAYNMALGERRANTVAAFLKKMGVAEHRISAISFGSRVLEPGDNEDCYAKNRVAVLVVK